MTLWWKSHLHQLLWLIVTTRTVILISYFPLHQPWLPHPPNLRPWKQHAVWTIQVHSFFLILFTKSYTCILFLTLYYTCTEWHWRDLFDYLVMCPKVNNCQMLCKNCFHQDNQKLHAVGVIMSFWCMGVVKIKNGVDITFGAFVYLIHNKIWEFSWYAWLITIWLKGFVSKDTVICVTMVGKWSD